MHIMSVLSLTEAIIRENATYESIQRGHDYYQHGMVQSLVKRGMSLQAEVEGSHYEPYKVLYTFPADNSMTASCTCPYDWGGWCKHIVAVGLTVLNQPERVEERPPIDVLLEGLDRQQLQTLLSKLVEQSPDLIERIEEYVALSAASPSSSDGSSGIRPHRPLRELDPETARRQVHSAMHRLDRMNASEAYWHVGAVLNSVEQILDRAWELIHADKGWDALFVLEAITEEYLSAWESLDDSDGEASEFFSVLGQAWIEALLSADLSNEERRKWVIKLDTWRQGLDDYGIEDVFTAPQEAALQGWDDPALQRVLQGHLEEGAREGEGSDYADVLTKARLLVLERRGRLQEYLYLAEAEHHTEEYLTMLVRLNRISEAVDYGLAHLDSPQKALTFAKALYDAGEREQALRIAEHGLTLPGLQGSLAKWLRDEAAALGKSALALTAAEAAFRAEVNLPNYLRIADFAEEQWAQRRPALLDYARLVSGYSGSGRVDVFLHEGLIDDAINAVGSVGYTSEIEKVVNAALMTRPEWAIQTSRKQAEAIMDEGRAQHYDIAVRWLMKTRTAYFALGHDEEWRAYLADLLTRHHRKYKLIPLLQGLRVADGGAQFTILHDR